MKAPCRTLIRQIVERRGIESKLREAERTARGTLDALSKHIAILDAGVAKGPEGATAAMDRHLAESRRWALNV